ncbi:MAG: diphosphomevalonate decarboxylase [Gammaproteobacteria bacterium]
MNNKTQSSDPHSTDADNAIVAVAHPNIALIKYWGKRDTTLNLPAVGSVSITLDTLTTTTRMLLDEAADNDRFELNNQPASAGQLRKLTELAQAFRQRAGVASRVSVSSNNNFPTAAGLASSASGYAALVVALNQAFGTNMSLQELSAFARMGSGSAARSLFGGFAQMHLGNQDDGTDSVAEPLLDESVWPLEVVVAIASESAKDVSSTVGMEATRNTSPFYQPWINSQGHDIETAIAAIKARDFSALGEVSEYSCLKMHGLMLSAQPGLVYWNAATLACIHTVRSLRAQGVPVFFTIDAGPQLKAVCAPGASDTVAQALQQVDGVSRVVRAGLGPGAKVVECVRTEQ